MTWFQDEVPRYPDDPDPGEAHRVVVTIVCRERPDGPVIGGTHKLIHPMDCDGLPDGALCEYDRFRPRPGDGTFPTELGVYDAVVVGDRIEYVLVGPLGGGVDG